MFAEDDDYEGLTLEQAELAALIHDAELDAETRYDVDQYTDTLMWGE